MRSSRLSTPSRTLYPPPPSYFPRETEGFTPGEDSVLVLTDGRKVFDDKFRFLLYLSTVISQTRSFVLSFPSFRLQNKSESLVIYPLRWEVGGKAWESLRMERPLSKNTVSCLKIRDPYRGG